MTSRSRWARLFQCCWMTTRTEARWHGSCRPRPRTGAPWAALLVRLELLIVSGNGESVASLWRPTCGSPLRALAWRYPSRFKRRADQTFVNRYLTYCVKPALDGTMTCGGLTLSG